MDFVAVSPGVSTWCEVAEPAHLRFMGIPCELARACLERDADDPLDFGPIHTGHHGDPLIAQGLDLLWQELVRHCRQATGLPPSRYRRLHQKCPHHTPGPAA